jgi:PAS domain S-box-containing protein
MKRKAQLASKIVSFELPISTRTLSSRLIMGFVVTLLGTTLAAAIPAYVFITNELEKQAWERVENGSRITQALLDVEKDRLDNLVTLTSQRPTLQDLIENAEITALDDYLRVFRSGLDLDILVVRDTAGTILAKTYGSVPWSNPPCIHEVGFNVCPCEEHYLSITACSPVFDTISGEHLGYVTIGNYLDSDFMKEIASQTGFTQSVITENKRRSSSIESTEGEKIPIDDGASDRALSENVPVNTPITIQGTRYYTVLLPIRDLLGQPISLVEIALPVDSMLAAEHRALLTLNISTLAIIALGTLLAGFYARRITYPINQLTQAATNISEGDLATPVPSFHEPIEIETLSQALESSRENTRRVLEHLSRSKAWSETLIQSITEGIVTVDNQSIITSFSHGAERITGWMRGEVIDKHLNEVFRLPDGEGSFTDHITPHGRKRQVNILTRSGKLLTLAVTDAQLLSPDRNTYQLALVLRDITEETATRTLQSYFLANITHEFRTPLSALNASVELLLEEMEDLSPAEMGKLLNSIHMSVSGLQTLIDNLLESISIEAGRFNIHRRPTELRDVVLEAVRVMKPLLDRRQQSLSISQPDRREKIMIDPTRISQVLVNLISNASKYSPISAPIDLIIEQSQENLLHFTVADRGPGITPLDRANLFRRFVRLGDEEGAQYGIGLGLSVVKAIVEEHGGEVGVDERPGGGSIFWFTLPFNGGDS